MRRLPSGSRARGLASVRRLATRIVHDERGQTFTEYIMISGFIVMVGLFVMKAFQLPFRQRLQDMASYVINNAADIPW
jgi:Flp pilus assembly pilin Flp